MKNIALAACATFMLLLFQVGSVQSQTASGQTVKSSVQITKVIAEQQPLVKCIEDSPELAWGGGLHDSGEQTPKKAAGPDGVAAEAHGSVWLMTVEAQTEEHHGGRHVAWIAPLAMPAADRYSMRVQSSLLRCEFQKSMRMKVVLFCIF